MYLVVFLKFKVLRGDEISTKRKNYSNEFKTKLVLEVLENNATINKIASKYNILPKAYSTLVAVFNLEALAERVKSYSKGILLAYKNPKYIIAEIINLLDRKLKNDF
jgi:hypothetical protein